MESIFHLKNNICHTKLKSDQPYYIYKRHIYQARKQKGRRQMDNTAKHSNSNWKKADMALLIPIKIYFKVKDINRGQNDP